MGPAERRLRIELVRSPAPRRVETLAIDVPEGSCIADALRRAGWLAPDPNDEHPPSCGIWGRKQPLDALLSEGDRVELYRDLQVDPKQARRLRYKGQKRPPRKTA